MAVSQSKAEAIRQKIAKLKGSNNGFSPDVGTYTIRLILLKGQAETEEPIPTVPWYYLDTSVVAPSFFGEEDPVEQLRKSLYADGSDSSKIVAKQLFARDYGYVYVIDRSKQAEGPLLWRLRNDIAADLLEYWVKEDYGDIADVDEGLDLDLTVSKTKAKVGDKDVLKFVFAPKRKNSPLHDNPDTVKKWLAAVSSLSTIIEYGKKSAADIEKSLDSWLEKAMKIAMAKGKDKEASAEKNAETVSSSKTSGEERPHTESDEDEDNSTEEKSDESPKERSVDDLFSKYKKNKGEKK